MGSVQLGAGYLTADSAPHPSFEWHNGLWVKANAGAYGGGPQLFLHGGEGPPFERNIGIKTEGDELIAYVDNSDSDIGGAYDEVVIATGNNTEWWFISFDHGFGASTYLVRWLQFGETTFQSATIDAVANNAGTPSRIGAHRFSGGNAVDGLVRHYFAYSWQSNDADLLTASDFTTAPPSTPVNYLDLDSATNAEVEGGSAANWAITGSLSTDSGEPGAGGGGGGGPSHSWFAQPQPLARTYYPSKLPMGPLPRLGTGILAYIDPPASVVAANAPRGWFDEEFG